MSMLDVLFLIPARKGSKRFPGKNREIMHGRPLWELALCHAAEASSLLCNATESIIVVSTDDPEIKNGFVDRIFERLERPVHLATDRATNEAVALHALEHYPADMVCLVQPTSPLRVPLDIVRCIIACPGYTCNLDRDRNGAVYTCFSEYLRDGRSFSDNYYQRVLMPHERSIDIDTPEDLARARSFIEKRE